MGSALKDIFVGVAKIGILAHIMATGGALGLSPYFPTSDQDSEAMNPERISNTIGDLVDSGKKQIARGCADYLVVRLPE